MTDGEIIDALGGPTLVAALLGIKMPVVSAWKSRMISWQKRPAVAQLARKKRLTIPHDFLTERR